MATGLVPAECGSCQPVDLDPENLDVWILAKRFKSMIRKDGQGWLFVDYEAARTIAEMTGQADPLYFLECIEVIKTGLTSGK